MNTVFSHAIRWLQVFPVCFCVTDTWLFYMSENHSPGLHDILNILGCSVVAYKSFYLCL